MLLFSPMLLILDTLGSFDPLKSNAKILPGTQLCCGGMSVKVFEATMFLTCSLYLVGNSGQPNFINQCHLGMVLFAPKKIW